MKTHPLIAFLLVSLTIFGCGKKSTGADPQLSRRGCIEVTARLIEVPDGAIFQRDLYDYAAILQYEVTAVHRGTMEKGAVVYIGHYNPWKSRSEVADKKVLDVGGSLREFRAGDSHRMALETPMDDFYLGGIVDKYFGKHEAPAFWAVWTNPAD